MYKFFRGLCNVFRWLPIIWRDRDWDWYYLAKIMEYKLNRMAKVFENGHHLYGWRDAKQCRICVALLHRLLEDEYHENAKISNLKNSWAIHGANMMKQDQEYLGKILGKYLTHWWD